MATKPSLRLLFAHPAHFFALGCGSGLAPKAPGTFGTLFAWASFALFHHHFSDFGLFLLLTVAFIAGIWFIDITGRALGDPDHGSIVWDEIVPFWLVLFMTPDTFFWQLTAFMLFPTSTSPSRSPPATSTNTSRTASASWPTTWSPPATPCSASPCSKSR